MGEKNIEKNDNVQKDIIDASISEVSWTRIMLHVLFLEYMWILLYYYDIYIYKHIAINIQYIVNHPLTC